MGRRKNNTTPRANAHWVITEELVINSRKVVRGTELKIKGERGRFRFIKHVDTGTKQWIDVYGGLKGHEMLRSFPEDRVMRVHRDRQSDTAMNELYKEKKKVLREEKSD